MPNVAWRKFCDFSLDKEIEYTPTQKTAALCVRYYFGIQGDGYAGFFDYYGDIDNDELVQALTAAGVPEFAENFIEAVENAPNEDYGSIDEWFYKNADTLLVAIEKLLQDNTGEFYEIVDEDYTLRPPKDGFWGGAIITAVVFIFGVIAASTNPNPTDRLLFLHITITGFALTCLILFIYAERWKISIKRDVLTVRLLFRPKRVVRIDEISEAMKHNKGIIIYTRGKRLLRVSRGTRGFGMFFAQLDLAGKITEKQKAKFAVRLSTERIITGIIFFSAGIWALIWTFQRDYNPANLYEKTFFSAAAFALFLYLAHCLLWRVKATEDHLAIRKAFGRGAEYQISDISQVNINKQKMAIMADGRIVAKIAPACKGYNDLIRKLQSANVPFYRNGKRWRYEMIPIAEQLDELGRFGIVPKHDDFIEWIHGQWGTQVISSDPNELLMVLGGVRKIGDSWERLSDDVIHFDLECVDDSNSYTSMLEQLVALSKGALKMVNIHCDIDRKRKEASVSFQYNDADCKWDLVYNDDWFDIGVVLKMNSILMNAGSTQFFYINDPPDEQGVIVVFSSQETIWELNLLTDFPFILNVGENSSQP